VWNPPISNPSNDLTFTINAGKYPVPTLSSIAPNSAVAGSITPLQVSATGTNFAGNAVLNFNGATSQILLITSDHTFLQALVPASAFASPGTVQVTVSNPSPGGGPSNSLPFTITAPSLVPTISSLNPSSAMAGAFVTVTVTGTGFQSGAQVCIGTPTGVGCDGTTFISSTQLSTGVSLPNTTGTIAFYVVDPAPAGTSAPFNFTVTQPPPPTINSISPVNAPTGSRPTLTISGTNFLPQSNILFNNQNNLTANSILVSSTQLTTTLLLDSVASGTYLITVVNLVGTPMTSNAVNFTVTGPPDFSITSSGSTTQTVAAGQTATFTNAISVTAQNGFSAQVNLSCSLPVTATATTCTVTPNMFASGSGTATAKVTTMARGFAPPLLPRGRVILLHPQFLPLILLSILLAAILARFARTRRQRFAGALPLALLVLFLTIEAIGCGAGSSPPPPPPPPTGTPAGTYTVTVTATSGTLTHNTTLTLVVQ
jgi:hypothetical protein